MIAWFLLHLRRLVRRPPILQVAALCWREAETGREILMIRSLTSKRWIIPKGWPMPGRTLAEAAVTEAWEEAGVRPAGAPDEIGVFHYDKRRASGVVQPCEVRVFALEVESLADTFPESGLRARKWLPAGKAAEKVQEADLAALILAQPAGPRP